MRKRDLGILLLSAFAIFFSLQHGGDLSFKEAWVHLLDEYPVKYESERLPPPVVADLNGDGKSEILVATHDAKIQVLEPHALRVDGGFAEAHVLSEISLLPDKVRVSTGRHPVAMAAGFVDRSYKKGEIMKQVIVVVTSGWSVMCFDHNLKKLWEENLQDDFPHGAYHREIAISISNYTLKHGDTGLIIIGGRMEMKNHILMESFEESVAYEQNSEHLRRSAFEKENNGSSGTVDLRHFAFYAFAGRSGALRWSRKHEKIEEEHSDASRLIPQHNYKLDAQALNARRPGEYECKEFRESVLGVMPHSWERREDTYFQLAHFTKHKRKLLKKTNGKANTNPFTKPVDNHAPGKDSSNKISNALGKVASYAGSSKPKKKIPYVPTITNYTQLWWIPNVIVAHQKEGIEAIHLASGRTICKLHLPEGGLHADINGDGVLDHVQVVGGNVAERTVVTGSMEVLKPCYAVATSGVPVREQLFNASICHHTYFNLFQHVDYGRNFGRQEDLNSLEVATPILIPRDEGHKDQKEFHGDLVFLTNRGEITSYSPVKHGDHVMWNWQLSTSITWSNLPSPSGTMETTVVPTLKTFPLLKHGKKMAILAAGESLAVVLSPGGSELAEIYLPGPPTHTLVVDDFSNDGLNDIILVTSSGVYGYVQTRQPGALFFSTLVGCLIVIIAAIFVSQHFNSSGKGKPRPSGDHR